MARCQPRRASWLSARVRIVPIGILAATTLTAGVVLAPAASASTGGPIYSLSGSGYQVSGRWFHSIQTEVQLPSNAQCAQLYNVVHPGAFSVTVELGSPDPSAQLIISDVPTSSGCGSYTVEWNNAGTVTPDSFPMSPGDVIKMGVFYDQTSPPENGEHSLSGHLEDMTSGNGAVIGDLASATYTTAQIIGGFGSFAAPASQFRAFEFTHSAAETYTGHGGTLIGPWTTSQVVMTSNGQSSGTVEANSPILWDSGRAFGTWVRAAA